MLHTNFDKTLNYLHKNNRIFKAGTKFELIIHMDPYLFNI